MTKHERNRVGYIYFVEMVRPRLVKVGYAANVADRLANLRTASPFDLRLMHWFIGTKEDERRIQIELRPHRYRREWFHPHDAIEDLIEDIYEFQVDVIAQGPFGHRTDLGARPILNAVSRVPVTGYWDWRDAVALQEAS